MVYVKETDQILGLLWDRDFELGLVYTIYMLIIWNSSLFWISLKCIKNEENDPDPNPELDNTKKDPLPDLKAENWQRRHQDLKRTCDSMEGLLRKEKVSFRTNQELCKRWKNEIWYISSFIIIY